MLISYFLNITPQFEGCKGTFFLIKKKIPHGSYDSSISRKVLLKDLTFSHVLIFLFVDRSIKMHIY